MGTLSVDPTQMHTDAEGFNLISTKSGEIASYLRNALDLLGSFWGNDAVGREFLSQWDPAVRGMIDALTGIGDGILKTSNGIITPADLYKKSNYINTAMVR